MKVKILLLVLFLLLTGETGAQIMFQRHYGGNADDYGSRVLQMDDGGYLVASITESFGAGSGDIYLIRTNEYGDVQWTKTYGGVGDEQPNAMKKTTDGNIIIAGRTSSYGAGSTDCFLLKINQNGDTLWTKTYGGTNEENALDIIQTSDGGFLLIGSTLTFTHSFSSAYAIKVNDVGDTLWTKTYEKKISNSGTSAIQLTDGGYYIVGQTGLPGQLQASDCYFIRTNALGDTLWTKTYGGNNYDGAFQCYDNGDGLIISGTTKSFGSGNNDIFLSKFDYFGNNIWYKTYGGLSDEIGGRFARTNDNGFILTGYTSSYGMGNQDAYLIKTDNNGDTVWTRNFGYSSVEFAISVIQTSDNGYAISGYTNNFGAGFDVYLIKTNSQGISGFSKIIRENIECKVFPNPSNGNLNIKVNDTDNTNFNLVIYDISGKRMFEKKELSFEENTQSIDLTRLRDGFYLLQLCFENICVTKKIIIQK